MIMASIGGPLALFLTHTNFSVSSAVGFLALFGVSVETGVIMIEFINQLRAPPQGHGGIEPRAHRRSGGRRARCCACAPS